MKIQLLRRYRGALTDEQWLDEGIHELEPSLAEYLVTNGHATLVDTPPVAVIPQAVEPDDSTPSPQPKRKR